MKTRRISFVLIGLPVLCALTMLGQDKAPTTPLKGDLARGKIIFDNTCAECHDGYSKEETIGPGLQGMKNGKLPDGNKATFDTLLELINRGPAEMPSFKDRLTEQQKADVVTFVLTL